MLSKEKIEEAKKFLWDIDDYLTEHSTDENGNVIDEDMNEKATKINNANYYIMQLEQENKNLKKILNNGLDKNKKYCFNEDGNTGKCLGYSNINDDEPCEYCKSCEALSIKGED